MTLRVSDQELERLVESPIEWRLLNAILPLGEDYSLTICVQDDLRADDHGFIVIPQFKWRRYRSDFCFFVDAGRAKTIPILVECDGHLFHERTAAQAEHDRRKDMLAQQDGYSIIRFTGSQIYRNANECVVRLLDFAGSKMVRGKGERLLGLH